VVGSEKGGGVMDDDADDVDGTAAAANANADPAACVADVAVLNHAAAASASFKGTAPTTK
jgi:hypothetical protein